LRHDRRVFGANHAHRQTYLRPHVPTPFADRIRNEVGIRTIAVGAITEADQVNSIIAAGRADLCAIARPHLANPAWTLHEAAKLQKQVDWPKQYLSGRDQLYRELAKQNTVQNTGVAGVFVASSAMKKIVNEE
jgi:anthraniloyl-CoA monooxygenase